MTVAEKIERDGYVGEIEYDDNADKPDFDGLGHIFTIHYSHSYGYGTEVENEDGCDRSEVEDVEAAINRVLQRWGKDWDRIERFLWLAFGARIDWTHWGRDGADILAVATSKLRDAWGNPDGEPDLESRQAYRDGEVYGYTVTGPAGEHVDSCWGYYGDRELDYVRSRINEEIDDALARRHAERAAMFKRLVGCVT